MGDTRITLRLNEVELEEIDDFIARHPEFHNRSEFVRQVVMSYIKDAHREEVRNPPQDRAMEQVMLTLEEYVEYGYFRDMWDLILYVFRVLMLRGELQHILKDYVNQVRSIRLDEDLRVTGGHYTRR